MVRASAVLTLRAYLAAMIGNSAGPRPDEVVQGWPSDSAAASQVSRHIAAPSIGPSLVAAMGLLCLLDRWLVAVVSRVRCGR
jgi:hypothetical protein